MNQHEINIYKNSFYKKHGRFPRSIPMTHQELTEFNSNNSIEHNLNGFEVEVSPLAKEIRYKRVELKYAILKEDLTIPLEVLLKNNFTWSIQEIQNEMIYHLTTKILSDTETLEIEVECDPFAKLKRIFKITPKKKKISIETRTLYSRLAVKFPENSHSVHYNVLEQ